MGRSTAVLFARMTWATLLQRRPNALAICSGFLPSRHAASSSPA
jgi:hypothetical protein